MMKTTLTANRRLVPGERIGIDERDEHGALVGSWDGYYRPDTGTVVLYPRKDPFCYWRVARTKHEVSDRAVRVAERVTAPAKAKPKPKEGVESSTRRLRKLPIEGQERMKI